MNLRVKEIKSENMSALIIHCFYISNTCRGRCIDVYSFLVYMKKNWTEVSGNCHRLVSSRCVYVSVCTCEVSYQGCCSACVPDLSTCSAADSSRLVDQCEVGKVLAYIAIFGQ